MSGEHNTFIQLINSNNLFYSGIESKELTLDFNIRIEIILLYLKTRFNDLEKLKLKNIESLKDLIMNDNYQIVQNNLIYKGNRIRVEELYFLVRMVRIFPNESKAQIYRLKDLQRKANREQRIVNFPRPAKIIPFKAPKVLSYEEMSKKFNATYLVDEAGKEYIKETKADFRNIMNQIIDSLLTNSLGELDISTLKLLSGLLDIYALNYYYAHDKDFIKSIQFPIKKIGIGKSNYQVPEITAEERSVTKIKEELMALSERERFIQNDQLRLYKVKTEEEKLSIEIMNILLELSNLKEKPENYNPHLLENIMRSIEANTVEVSINQPNTRIRFFHVIDNKTVFHSTMNLDTLASLFDKKSIIVKNEPKFQTLRRFIQRKPLK